MINTFKVVIVQGVIFLCFFITDVKESSSALHKGASVYKIQKVWWHHSDVHVSVFTCPQVAL